MSPAWTQARTRSPRRLAAYSNLSRNAEVFSYYDIILWSATNESRSCASPIERKPGLGIITTPLLI